MKIRKGFVSNSSSSSFIVGATEEEIAVMKRMFGNWCYEEYFIENFDPEDSEVTEWLDDDEIAKFKDHVFKIKDVHLNPVLIEVSYHNEELNDFVNDLPYQLYTFEG